MLKNTEENCFKHRQRSCLNRRCIINVAEKRKSPSERIAVLETEISYIKASVGRIEVLLGTLADNHLVHLKEQIAEVQSSNEKRCSLIEQTIKDMREFCTRVQDGKKVRMLSGREKAVIYGTTITVIGTCVVELIKNFV
jgi:hypothetical protein